MSASVAPTSTDRSDFRTVMVSGTKMGALTAAAVVLLLLVARFVPDPGGARRGPEALRVPAAGGGGGGPAGRPAGPDGGGIRDRPGGARRRRTRSEVLARGGDGAPLAGSPARRARLARHPGARLGGVVRRSLARGARRHAVRSSPHDA